MMTPDQRARLETWISIPAIAAALAHIDALEARVGEAEALVAAYNSGERVSVAWLLKVDAKTTALLAAKEQAEAERDSLKLELQRAHSPEYIDHLQAERDETIRGRDAIALLLVKAKAERDRLKVLLRECRDYVEECRGEAEHAATVTYRGYSRAQRYVHEMANCDSLMARIDALAPSAAQEGETR